MHKVTARMVLAMAPAVCLGEALPEEATAQEHKQSVSHSSDYAPALHPPDLEDLTVYLDFLEKLDLEITTNVTLAADQPVAVIPPIPQSPVQAESLPAPAAPVPKAQLPAATSMFNATRVGKVPEIEMPTADEQPPDQRPLTSVMSLSERLVLNVKGTGTEVHRQVPDETGMTSGYLDARCFSADVYFAQSGVRAGVVEQCLSEISSGVGAPSLSGKQMIETTIFRLKEGRLVVQELSTVQPLNWSAESDDGVVYTHMTGSASVSDASMLSDDQPFYSTGEFKHRTVLLRSSGMLDLSREHEGGIAIDSIFTLDLQ